MTKDEIIDMAESCFIKSKNQIEFIELFAKLVAEHEREKLIDAAMKAAEKGIDTAIALEREACAEVCKRQADVYAGLEPSPIAQSAWAACIDNHDFIRARGQA